MQEPRQVICNLKTLQPFRFCLIAMLAAIVAVRPVNGQNKVPAKAADDKTKAAKPILGKFSPPPVVPEIMKIEKPLMTEQEEAAFPRSDDAKAFNRVFKDNPKTLNAAAQKAIDAGAKFYVYRMSMKSHRHHLPKKRVELQRLFHLKAKLGPARNYFLQQVKTRAIELLDGNFHVRMNAVFQLSELDQVPENAARKIPAVAYAESLDPLVAVINDKDQPDAIKIPAVRGVMRILALGDPNVIDEKKRFQVSDDCVRELQRQDAHYYYANLLARTLGMSGIVYDRARKVQFVPDALLAVIVDKNRNWSTRCEAAKAIGRLPLDGSSKVKDITGGLVNLSHEMALAYNKVPRAFYWKGCFWDLYFCFRAPNAQVKPVAGLLNNVRILSGNNGSLVKGAYQVLLPLVQHVLKQPVLKPLPIDQKKIDDVLNWLKSNKLMQAGAGKKTPGKTPSAEEKRKPPVESASIRE